MVPKPDIQLVLHRLEATRVDGVLIQNKNGRARYQLVYDPPPLDRRKPAMADHPGVVHLDGLETNEGGGHYKSCRTGNQLSGM